MRLEGVPRQQCAENQIADDGFHQGAGRLLVASRNAEVVGDHNVGGQYQPKPKPEHQSNSIETYYAASSISGHRLLTKLRSILALLV
jgi:hypothetical protein